MTADRDALATALHRDGPCVHGGFDYCGRADRILANLPPGWRLTREAARQERERLRAVVESLPTYTLDKALTPYYVRRADVLDFLADDPVRS